MKILTLCISSLLVMLFLFLPLDAGAEPPPPYQPLAPLPGIEGPMSVAEYFKIIYQIGISLVLVIGVVLLVIGGIQYMTSDSIGGKSNGRDTIARAIIGIVLAVTGYAILFVIGGTGSVTVGFELPPVTYTPPPPPPDGTDPDDPERYCQVSLRTTTESFNSEPRCPDFQDGAAVSIALNLGGQATGVWISRKELIEYYGRGGNQLNSTCRFLLYEHPLSIDMGTCGAKAADLFKPGDPAACLADSTRRATPPEEEYFCEVTPFNPERKQVLFKLPTGHGADRSGEPGVCFQVDPRNVQALGEDLCEGDGGDWELINSPVLGEPVWFCFADATEAECTNLLAGKFRELAGLDDLEWDESFCDLRDTKIPSTVTGGQRQDFKDLGTQFLDDLGLLDLSDPPQSSGYYNDQDYYNDSRAGGGRWHTGIDLRTNGQGVPIKAPVKGRVYIMRTPDYSPDYARNGKIAIIETLPNGEERAWVFTHMDKFADGLQNGDIVEAGSEFAHVGLNPCFPTTMPECDGGTHLDLNIYTSPELLSVVRNGPTNHPINWSGMASGRHHNTDDIAAQTMCPFQAYWESINPST